MGDVIRFERRKSVRTPCSTPAFATLGDLVISGTILDRSETGVYFTPEVAYIDGQMVTDPDRICEALEVDDQLVISFQSEGRGRGSKTVSARVRWLGSAHDTAGFGLELMTASGCQPASTSTGTPMLMRAAA